MKFSQKLVCIMLLVIAAFFAVGGAVLVNGSFMDRLSAAAEQEQSMHAMLCGVVEDYYLDQTGRGEDTCGDDFITAATWRAGDLARGVYSQGLFRASADPAQDEAYAIYGLQDGQSILQYGPNVTRTYRSDLLGGLVMVTTFDVTEPAALFPAGSCRGGRGCRGGLACQPPPDPPTDRADRRQRPHCRG